MNKNKYKIKPDKSIKLSRIDTAPGNKLPDKELSINILAAILTITWALLFFNSKGGYMIHLLLVVALMATLTKERLVIHLIE